MTDWTTNDIPSLAGKLAVITGATGGLGYETALVLAQKGAEVVLTGRNERKGSDALAAIRARAPAANISYMALDLSSLAKINTFVTEFSAGHDRIDILVNNAGVMAPNTRQVTDDGFELQFGTNYLGHFALTARALPLLAKSRSPRLVQLSSGYAAMGKINLDDLQAKAGYRPYTAYAQSKLAMLMFALELQRQSDRAGWGLVSTAAHPGVARTDLIANGPGTSGLSGVVTSIIIPLISQTSADGALPQLFAATSPDVRPGGYYGPSNMFELKGPPKDAKIPGVAKDTSVAARLWSASEQLTGVRFPALAVAA
jgi:NAD(P)-dependent dehydrogenase (short-subunit alcohol dehydrogenase family)